MHTFREQVDDDFIAAYQASYGFVEEQGGASASTTALPVSRLLSVCLKGACHVPHVPGSF